MIILDVIGRTQTIKKISRKFQNRFSSSPSQLVSQVCVLLNNVGEVVLTYSVSTWIDLEI